MATTLENEVLMDSTSNSDAELMQRVASGDISAFEQLVLRHQERAWALACHMLADASEAQASGPAEIRV